MDHITFLSLSVYVVFVPGKLLFCFNLSEVSDFIHAVNESMVLLLNMSNTQAGSGESPDTIYLSVTSSIIHKEE